MAKQRKVKPRKETSSRRKSKAVVKHDADLLEEERLTPLEIKKRAKDDANAAFDKFVHELA